MRTKLFLVIYLVGSISGMEAIALQSDCVGSPRAPVRAVYLAGVFPQNLTNLTDPETLKEAQLWLDIESKNRAYMKELALKLGIRIAIPLPPFTKKMDPQGFYYWTSTVEEGSPRANLKQIDRLAQSACNGTPLTKPKALIAFSNGGNLARLLCAEPGIIAYAKIFAMNYNNSEVSSQGCNSNQLTEFGANDHVMHNRGLFGDKVRAILENGLSALIPRTEDMHRASSAR